MVKRVLSFFLIVIMVLGILPGQVSAADNVSASDNIMDNIIIEDGANVDVVIDGQSVTNSGETRLPSPTDLVTQSTELPYVFDAPVDDEAPAAEEVCECADLASAVEHGGICQVKLPYMELCKDLSAGELFAQWASYAAAEQAFLLEYLNDEFPLKHFELEKLLKAPTGCASDTYVDGTTVSVQGIPQDGSLTIGEATDEVQQIVDAYVAEKEETSTPLFSYDVSVQDGEGADWQPETNVKMELELPGEKLHKNTKVFVVHVDDDGVATTIEATVTEDGKIAFETPGFSAFFGFTVDFDYNGATFSINGLSSIKLSELFAKLYMPVNVEDVADVVFTNNEYIRIEKQEADWELISLKAFSTTEALTLTMNDGQSYEIKVTDAQYAKVYCDSVTDGLGTYDKNWDTDSNGIVTWQVADEGIGDPYESPGYSRTEEIIIYGPGTMTIKIENELNKLTTTALYLDLYRIRIQNNADVTIMVNETTGTYQSQNKIVGLSSCAYDLSGKAGHALIWVENGSLTLKGSENIDLLIGGDYKKGHGSRDERSTNYARWPLVLLSSGAKGLTVKDTQFIHGAAGAIGSQDTSVPTSLNISLEDCYFHKSIYNALQLIGGAVQHWQTGNGGSFSAKNCTFNYNESTADSGGAIGVSGGIASFTLENCTFNGCKSPTGKDGGVIVIRPGGQNLTTFSMTGCQFNGTSGTMTCGNRGGAISLEKGVSNLTVQDCTFSNISAPNHGGVFCVNQTGDVAVPITNATFTGCTFTNCSAAGRGGAIRAISSTATTLKIDDCDFNTCTATTSIGGAVSWQGSVGNVTINNGSTFNDCYANGRGGAFSITCYQVGNILIDSSTFSRNTADSHGGAVHVGMNGAVQPINVGTVNVTNCTFENNKALGMGGGLCLTDGRYQSITLTNTTFDGCKTPGYGGGFGMKIDSNNAPFSVVGDVQIISCTFKNCFGGKLTPEAYVTYDQNGNEISDPSQANIQKWKASENAELAGLDMLNGASGSGAMILGGEIGGKLLISGESTKPMLIENCATWNNGGAICFADDLRVLGIKNESNEVVEAVTIQHLNINKCFARDSGSAIYFGAVEIALLDMNNCTIQNCGYFDQDDPNFDDPNSTTDVASLIEISDDWFQCQNVLDLSKPTTDANGNQTYEVDKARTEQVKADQLARWKAYTIAQLSPGTDYSGTIRTVGNTACAAQITNCEIMNNRSAEHGGAVYWNAGRIVYKDEATKNEVLVAASLTITNTKMHHNYARNRGGAVFCEGNATIESCEIYNNTADVAGGGVAQNIYNNSSRQLGESGPGEKSMLILKAATGGEPVKIYNNTAKNGGGIAITVDYTASYPHTIKPNTPEADKDKPVNWEFSKNFTYEVTFQLGGTHVYGNRALRNGGGVYYDVAYYQDRTDTPSDGVSWTERQRQVDSYIKNVQIDDGLIYSNIAGYSTTAVQVTDASTLKAGDLVVVAAKDYNYAMSTGMNIDGEYHTRQRTELKKDSAGRMIVSDTTEVLTLVKGTEEGTFALRLPSGQYLRAASYGRFKLESSISDKCYFTLAIDPNTGAATIAEVNSYYEFPLRYIAADGIFRTYSDPAADVVIYRVEPSEGGNGGGVYVNSNQYNTADTIPAGQKTGSSTVAITGGQIYKNSAYIGNGGGVYLTGVNALCSISGETTTIGAQYLGKTSDGKANLSTDGGNLATNKWIATDNYVGGCGGGIAIFGGARIEMEGGYIVNNEASTAGGAVSVHGEKSTMYLHDGYIEGNESSMGGGISLNGAKGNSSATDEKYKYGMFFDGGIVRNNIASYNQDKKAYGGGICISNSATMKLAGGEVSGNKAATSGNSTLYEANQEGGGIAVCQSSSMTITSGYIFDNKAYCGGGITIRGGSYVRSSGSVTVSNGVVTSHDGSIYSNFAQAFGGGIYMDKGTEDKYNEYVMESGYLWKNWADYDKQAQRGGGKGGAAYVRDYGKFTMTGGRVEGNWSSDGGAIHVLQYTVTNIKGGTLIDNYSARNGGAIYNDYGTVNIENGEFINNYAYRNGGAIFNFGLQEENKPFAFQITGGTFTGNVAQIEYGGAICCSGGEKDVDSGDVYISSGTFTNNAAKYGGGIKLEKCTVVIEGGTFQENISNRGGGMYAKSCPTVTISNLKILNNHCRADDRISPLSGMFGGGLYIEAYTGNCDVTINTGEFSGNTAPKAGGIMVYNSSENANITAALTINGGTISENKALSSDGGGICVVSTTLIAKANMTMNGGTISKNTAAGNGGGVFADTCSTVLISTGPSNGETTYGEITENTANNGGGVFVTGGADLTVIGGYITYNNATEPAGSSGLKTGYHQNTGLYGTGGGICVTQGNANALSTFTLQAPEGTNKMAIYGNMATFSADDVFSSGENTKLDVPAVAQMNLAGYGFQPEGWFEDYNTADTEYLSGINSKNPTEDDDEVFESKRYRNAVGNDRLRIAEDKVSSYVNTNDAYVAMTLGLPAAVDDTVVIDFTGEVDINLYKNDLCISMDEFSSTNSWLMEKLPEPDGETVTNKNYVYTSKGKTPFGKTSQDLKMVTANVWNGNAVNNLGVISYDRKWSSLSFTEEDTFGYVVVHNDYCYYAKVTVIPATTLYFEDNNGYYTSNGTFHLYYPIITYHTGDNLADWQPTYKNLSKQDQDRPGSADKDLQVPDADSVYGYDSHYGSTTTYSNGSFNYVQLTDKKNAARATFTFTGTGFDIISLCNSDTTAVMVNVFEGAGNIDFDNDMPLATYFVDTWYQAGDTLYQVPVIKADLTKVQMSEWDPYIPQYDEQGNIIGYGDYRIWDEDLGYGTYTVELYVATTWLNPEATDFYLDAIRIYNPAGVGDFKNAVKNELIQDAYVADNEGWPVYQELRDMFISANELKNNDKPTDGSILFIDRVQQENESGVVNKVPTISDYKNFGPNNEVYLAAGQAIAFTMDLDDYTNVAGIQVGLRSLNGKGKAQIKKEDGIPLQVLNELGTTDMYYSIPKKYSANKVIIIENTGKTPIAISNIKITHTSAPEREQTFKMFRADMRTAEIALEILNAEQLVDPVVTPKRPALSFNGMVCYNVFFTAEELGALTAEDLGLAVFDHYDAEGTVETAKDVIYGATKIGEEYMVATNGVHAKYLGDKQYFRAFAKKADGTYVYSKMVSYSALDYAKNALAKSDDVKLKQLVVAMLNYGAEAQKFFGYKTDDLMNASLTADDQALLAGFDATSLNAVGKVDASKVGAFASTGGFSKRSPAISFKGAFEINYFMTPANAVDGDMTLYFWNEDTYNAVGELTAQNADKAVTMTLENGSYSASSDEIAARYLDQTVYVAAVYESNGVRYCSGVLPYSIAAYCQKPPAGVQALATAAAIYGCTAKAYFGG